MKAAVIFQKGGIPQYTPDFTEPVVHNDHQVLITMKAAAIKHLDKSKARGSHYSAKKSLSQAKVIGGDGVGILPDGTRVFALGEGMLAEKAIIEKERLIKLPSGIDNATAAALPNAVAGSAAALLFRGNMKKGETILINGATGFTGKIAVQVAKYYGAGKIIVTGRNEQTLQTLKELGASEIVSVKQADESFIAHIKRLHSDKPIDIAIDYLWGHTAELILEALKGEGSVSHKTRFVSIGSVTGDKIQLSAEVLRSVNLHLTGSGLGSWSKDEMKKLFRKIIPKFLKLAADHKLAVDIITMPLQDIEKVWEMNVPDGKRLVMTM